MRCPHCGAQVVDGMKFCTSCGAPIGAPAEPAEPTTPVMAPVASVTPQEAPRKSSRGLVVAAVVMVVLAVSAVCGALVVTGVIPLGAPEAQQDSQEGPLGEGTPSKEVETSDEEASKEPEKDADAEKDEKPEEGPAATADDEGPEDEAEPEAKDETEAEDGAEPEPDPEPVENTIPDGPVDQDITYTASGSKSSVVLSLSDSEDFEDINMYLSNFTETGFDTVIPYDGVALAYDCANPDSASVMAFIEEHYRLNNHDIEAVPEDDASSNVFSTRSLVSTVEEDLSVMLNTSPSKVSLTTDTSSERGKYVLWAGAQGPSTSQGIASATSLENLGNNYYKVYFDVYVPDDLAPSDIGASWYGYSASDLKAAIGAGGVDRQGVAVFKVNVIGTSFRYGLCELAVSR